MCRFTSLNRNPFTSECKNVSCKDMFEDSCNELPFTCSTNNRTSVLIISEIWRLCQHYKILFSLIGIIYSENGGICPCHFFIFILFVDTFSHFFSMFIISTIIAPVDRISMQTNVSPFRSYLFVYSSFIFLLNSSCLISVNLIWQHVRVNTLVLKVLP